MYFFPDVVAARAESAGMRATVGMIVIAFPTVWAGNAAEYLEKGLEVRDALRHSRLVTTSFAPHAPYTVDDHALEKITVLAEELDCQVHMHIHETGHEISESTARFGVRPLERLDRLGLVSPRLAAVHMTHLLDAEIETVAERGVSVIHCPKSNLKLASGMCRVHDLLEAGANVAIGTDGASSNNGLDMLAEMQTASLLAKGVANDPSAMKAGDSLYAATLGGARALGMEEQLGSIEPGKLADLVAIDLSQASSWPVYHPLSQVVYACNSRQVSDVWIGGRRVLENRKPTRIDVDRVMAEAKQWGLKISAPPPSND
jgi:5-methylthioadenosine/S-adenosylhomocysteine deaminase